MLGTSLTVCLQNLKENLDAVNVRLTPEDIEEVRRVAKEADAAKGPRYPVRLYAVLFADTPPLQQ